MRPVKLLLINFRKVPVQSFLHIDRLRLKKFKEILVLDVTSLTMIKFLEKVYHQANLVNQLNSLQIMSQNMSLVP